MKAAEAIKNAVRPTSHAIKLLEQDHREVESLFKQFDETKSKPKRIDIVNKVCRALTIHADLEEQVFYPESRAVLKADDEAMVDEAVVEHATLKQLMLALKGKRPTDKLFEAHVTVLKEYVQHHVKEEENDYFKKVEKTSLDLLAIGDKMLKLKARLEKKMPAPAAGRASVLVQFKSAKPVSKAAPKKRRAVGR